MYTLEFWKGTLERAIFTFLQSFTGLIGAIELGIVDVVAFDWSGIFITSLFIGGLSLAKSLMAGLKDGNPSIGNVEVAVAKPTASEKLGG